MSEMDILLYYKPFLISFLVHTSNMDRHDCGEYEEQELLMVLNVSHFLPIVDNGSHTKALLLSPAKQINTVHDSLI